MPHFSKDSVATVGETGILYAMIGHLTSNVQRIKSGITILGTVVLAVLDRKPTPHFAHERRKKNYL